MTAIAGNIADFDVKHIDNDVQLGSTEITIGASGAIGSELPDDPGFAATKNGGTGDYTLAFPQAPKGRIVGIYMISAAGTVGQAKVISFDPVAGTLNFITSNPAGAATNPANGDKIHVTLALYKRG